MTPVRLVGSILWRREASLRAFYGAIRLLKALRICGQGRINCRAPRMKKPGTGPGQEALLDANQPAWHYGSGGLQRLSTPDGE